MNCTKALAGEGVRGAMGSMTRLALTAALVLAACGCSSDDEQPADPAPSSDTPRYTWLSETGLYKDIVEKTIAPDIRSFEPTYKLWSDAAGKQRWLRLPKGTQIDTSNEDRWEMPIGAATFKLFTKDGKMIETRLVERTGPGPEDYWMGSFLWNDDESDAQFVPEGQLDARGTTHDVPNERACWGCHHGEPGHMLGVSALQLSNPPGDGLTLAKLKQDQLLSTEVATVTVPGSETDQRALGYLHANCGHCHNPSGAAWPDSEMVLRLGAESVATVQETLTYQTTVGVMVFSYWNTDGWIQRIAPGDPAASTVLHRMTERGNESAMPPLATEVVDVDGVEAVRNWIESLPAPMP